MKIENKIITLSALILFILGIIIVRIPIFFPAMKSISSYITATIATFIGVLFAFQLSEYATSRRKKEEKKQKVKDNKEKTIKTLQATYEAIKQYEDFNIKPLIEFNDHKILKTNESEFPKIVEMLFNEPFYIENLSNEALFQIRNHYLNIRKANSTFYKLENDKEIQKEGEWLLFWTSMLIKVLEIENGFQHDTFSEDQLKERFKKHINEISSALGPKSQA